MLRRCGVATGLSLGVSLAAAQAGFSPVQLFELVSPSVWTLRVGSRVYAIGTPRGLETTISDGLLSGLRRYAQNTIEALQVSVPIAPGSSGGGLFDEQGRLIGTTTAGLRDSQNLNFAIPAASPPAVSTSWRLDYTVQRPELSVTMQLRARATETTVLRIGEHEYTAVRVNFTGYTRRRLPSMEAAGTYTAVAWYAPELERVVRFQVDTPLRQGSSSYARINEPLELVEIRAE